MLKNMTSNEKMLELLRSYKLEDLKRALEQNVREDHQKTVGNKKKDSAIINNMVKKSIANYPKQERFEKCHSFIKDGKELFGLTDGYRIFISENDFGYEHAEEFEKFKFESMLSESDKTNSFEIDRNEISLFCKDHKTKALNDKPYVFRIDDEHFAAFNPRYLLDAIDFCSSSKIFYSPIQSNILNTPILIKNEEENKIALILPVYIQENYIAYMKSWKESYNVM